ncbi:ubiquitin carboxyl-terminal hydrolase 14-like [Molothrus ater]|uniref:ubiquitin carboxyl-terminal hydrolase 14-like n=1 Tax=Molothrus ater TaxID=84834 RepID=UPI0023E87E92|nr:ubiquitin carboxyl-terminal hydrolase 14-like [Molothrus ater]
MPLFSVNVKWGKEKFDGVELNTDEPPMVFKAQLFALTGVQPARQKVMVKGGTLKDDDWGNLKIKNGMTLLMMGSADALPEEPVARPIFRGGHDRGAVGLGYGIAMWIDKPWQHLLHECYGSVYPLRARSERGP